jgi:hypothetical protein
MKQVEFRLSCDGDRIQLWEKYSIRVMEGQIGRPVWLLEAAGKPGLRDMDLESLSAQAFDNGLQGGNEYSAPAVVLVEG